MPCLHAQAPKPLRQGYERGYEAYEGGTFAWCTPKGHSAPFPIYAAARDGFAALAQCANKQRGGFRRSRAICGAPEQMRKLAVEGAGRGEVLHWCTPLSQPVRYSARPATSVCALAPPCPRGCATTTRRPRSRRRPRIGAGRDLVTKSINTIKLPPAHVSDERHLRCSACL